MNCLFGAVSKLTSNFDSFMQHIIIKQYRPVSYLEPRLRQTRTAEPRDHRFPATFQAFWRLLF